MENSIINYKSPNVKITPYSLEFGNGTTWEDARQIGIQLLRSHDSIQFYLGDWILFCSGMMGWGDKYTEALEKTDYPYSTLAVFTHVAKRFPPSQREQFLRQHKKLSFTKLREVSSLSDEQANYLLMRASEDNWSCAKLREEVQKYKKPTNKLKRWYADLKDNIKRTYILATPHIDKPVKGKRVYVLTGVKDLPELEGQDDSET